MRTRRIYPGIDRGVGGGEWSFRGVGSVEVGVRKQHSLRQLHIGIRDETYILYTHQHSYSTLFFHPWSLLLGNLRWMTVKTSRKLRLASARPMRSQNSVHGVNRPRSPGTNGRSKIWPSTMKHDQNATEEATSSRAASFPPQNLLFPRT